MSPQARQSLPYGTGGGLLLIPLKSMAHFGESGPIKPAEREQLD
jgi:hypothetical protein